MPPPAATAASSGCGVAIAFFFSACPSRFVGALAPQPSGPPDASSRSGFQKRVLRKATASPRGRPSRTLPQPRSKPAPDAEAHSAASGDTPGAVVDFASHQWGEARRAAPTYVCSGQWRLAVGLLEELTSKGVECPEGWRRSAHSAAWPPLQGLTRELWCEEAPSPNAQLVAPDAPLPLASWERVFGLLRELSVARLSGDEGFVLQAVASASGARRSSRWPEALERLQRCSEHGLVDEVWLTGVQDAALRLCDVAGAWERGLCWLGQEEWARLAERHPEHSGRLRKLALEAGNWRLSLGAVVVRLNSRGSVNRHWRLPAVLLSGLHAAGLQHNFASRSELVTVFGMGRRWSRALRVVLEAHQCSVPPDEVPYGACLEVCRRSGRGQEAAMLLGEMFSDGLLPSCQMYSVALAACEAGGHWQKAISLIDDMRRDHPAFDTAALEAAVRTLSAAQQWQHAQRLALGTQAEGVFCAEREQSQQQQQLQQQPEQQQQQQQHKPDADLGGSIQPAGVQARAEYLLAHLQDDDKLALFRENPRLMVSVGIVSKFAIRRQWALALSMLSKLQERRMLPDVVPVEISDILWGRRQLRTGSGLGL